MYINPWKLSNNVQKQVQCADRMHILLKVSNPQLSSRYWNIAYLFFLTSFPYYRSQITVIIEKSHETRWVKPCKKNLVELYTHTRNTAIIYAHKIKLHPYNFVPIFRSSRSGHTMKTHLRRYINILFGTLRSM